MNRKRVFASLSALLSLHLLPVQGADTSAAQREQVLALGHLTKPPRIVEAEGRAAEGTARAIYFEALPYQDKPTRVFAWLGLPKTRHGKVPGIVLVHGGGGTAFKEWVQRWNERGYAAISIAVEGQTDEKATEGQAATATGWRRHAWAGPERVGIYGDSDKPLEEQWIYHAVADTVLANSLLRALPEVDAEKVGVMGVSWGGVITSTAMGIDTRFAFAIPTYGCGHLFDAANQYGRALGNNTLYRDVWDPMVRMSRVKMPVLWLSWPADKHFPLDAQAACYHTAPGARMVSLIPGMKHGHGPAWLAPDSYAFADSVVQSGTPWFKQIRTELTGEQAHLFFTSAKKPDSATLVSTADTGFTGSRTWVETSATVEKLGDEWRSSARLPAGTTAWFINIRCGTLTASSDFQELNGDSDTSACPAWYPSFSWETVPLYQMFGSPEVLTPEQAATIAQTSDFICIEKAHGSKTLGAAELGAKHEIAVFKRLNPKTRALFYFNAARAWPFTTYSKGLRYGEICEELKPLIAKDPTTGELGHKNRIYAFNVLNPDFRTWWVETVAKGVRETGADGLFVDQMHGNVWFHPGKKAEVDAAQAEMMRRTKQALGPEKLLLLNNGAHIPALFAIGDAFMFEHYNAELLTKEQIAKDWALLKKISQAGKIAVWRIGVEAEQEEKLTPEAYERLSKERLQFYLAAFLIGAQQYSYFQYGWGWNVDNGPLVDYPDLRKPLGRPEGEARRESEWVFSRDFKHAKVRVDLEKREGSVTFIQQPLHSLK